MLESRRRQLALMVGLVVCLGGAARTAGDEAEVVYLSEPRGIALVTSTQAWGELGLDQAVRPLGREGSALRIGDQTYARGLGHHAAGELIVDLAGRYRTFDAEAGIQWQGGNTAGSVVFQVFVDGVKVYDSGVVRERDAARPISVSTKDAEELRLVVTDAGDGIACDCANWALARLTPDPAARDADRPEVDIAPFGRVMEWDPARVEGTAAGRTEEFPAEDIELGKELARDKEGGILVSAQEGRSSVGLQWPEARSLRRLELEFDDTAGKVPDDGEVAIEAWTGESVWQGRWETLAAGLRREGSRLVWTADESPLKSPTAKVRWVFPMAEDSVRVKRLAAFTRSRCRPEELRIEALAGRTGESIVPVEIYNGALVDQAQGQVHRLEWQTSRPLEIRVLSHLPRADKTDRTVLRFGSLEGGFSVSVEDVLAHREVCYAGVRVSTGSERPVDPRTPAVIPGVLDEVRNQPDMTLDRAMSVVHRDIQDLGPMMLSLACDNRKIVADREGAVRFDASVGVNDKPRDIPDQWRLDVRPGLGGDQPSVERRLRGGWLPMPTTVTREKDVVYEQTTYVAPIGEAKDGSPSWVRDQALGVVELTIRNEGEAEAESRLSLALTATGDGPVTGPALREAEGVWVAEADGRIMAIVDPRDAAGLAVEGQAAGVTLAGVVPASGEVRCAVLIPLWRVAAGQERSLLSGGNVEAWTEATAAYWQGILGSAMTVELPDRLLTDVIRASQVHCLLAARSEEEGRRVSAWISSDRYGPLESEANAVIRGMDMMGHTEFARRSLEFFIHRYDPKGFLTTGYTLVGTGEHLWTLAEHVERTPDAEWVRAIAPELKRVAQWIVGERSKTMRFDAAGKRTPSFGMMPPGVSADWNRFAYRFFNEAQYGAGLSATAKVLAQAGDPEAAALAEEAERYRADILTAYRGLQARSPVLPLGEGEWTAPQPALLGCFGHVEEFLPGEDVNRTWAYSIDLGAHHLAAVGILDPRSPEVEGMLEYLENAAFLRTGLGAYPEEESRRDPIGLGGFSKVQPFYARVAEIYAERDDVKPFLRSYFNGLSSLLSRENLSLWEHFHNMGGWNKTHETGWFLCQTRAMLVQERGSELWLGPMLPTNWLADGGVVSVSNAPTRFGKVSYTLRATEEGRRIEAEISPPAETPAELQRIVLRIRHPEGLRIQGVSVGGQPHHGFDVEAQTVTLPATAEGVTVRVDYEAR